VEEEEAGEIWFALWVWPFVFVLSGFPSLWAWNAAQEVERLLACSHPGSHIQVVASWAWKGTLLCCVWRTRAERPWAGP
jgi:hypothetical protein